MTFLKIEVPQEGKNVTVQVTGVLREDLVLTKIYETKAAGLRLDSVVWLIQEKMGVYLWWGKDDLLLPLESRGATRFDTGIANRKSDKWDGKIWVSTFAFDSGILTPSKAFHLTLDFDSL